MYIRVLFLAMITFAAAAPSFAQTCNPNITATTGHLIGNADGTVSDGKTKLMWKRCPEGFSYDNTSKACSAVAGQSSLYPWETALTTLPKAANEENGRLGFANKTGWRLPNIKELHSIVEEKCSIPAIRSDIFPSAAGVSVWSNSPCAAGLPDANTWYVHFNYGEMLYTARSQSLAVRLVRDCPECN